MSAGKAESLGREIVIEQFAKFRVVIYRKYVFYIPRPQFIFNSITILILTHSLEAFAILYALIIILNGF
jgi:hypothetical protein